MLENLFVVAPIENQETHTHTNTRRHTYTHPCHQKEVHFRSLDYKSFSKQANAKVGVFCRRVTEVCVVCLCATPKGA